MSHTATLPVLLKQLRLTSILQHWEPFLEQAHRKGWNPAQYLSALCEQELAERYSRRIARHTKESHLAPGKTLTSFDLAHLPPPKAAKIQALAQSPEWVRQAQNVLFLGASGVGKTHLASAVGHSLIERGVRVRHFSATALVQQLQRARQALRLEAELGKLDRYAVLILDDIGYVKKSETESYVLFELIAHRYETGSLIVTANQPFAEWDQIFPDQMMTVAAIDRLVHHATIIELTGDSYRRREALRHNVTLPREDGSTHPDESITPLSEGLPDLGRSEKAIVHDESR